PNDRSKPPGEPPPQDRFSALAGDRAQPPPTAGSRPQSGCPSRHADPPWLGSQRLARTVAQPRGAGDGSSRFRPLHATAAPGCSSGGRHAQPPAPGPAAPPGGSDPPPRG